MRRPYLDLDLERRPTYRFAMLSAMSMRSAAGLLRRRGLTLVGWRTLSLIGRHEPVHPSSIAERTSVDPDKVTRAVDRLVAKSYVARKADHADRRRVVLTLTASGQRIYAEIEAVRRGMERKFLSALSPQECRRFFESLSKLEAQARRLFTGKGAWKAIVGAPASPSAEKARVGRSRKSRPA
jgi:DNA-binding MarR family transcriptional regulator